LPHLERGFRRSLINQSINHLCMQPPDELMVQAFLPSMRLLVSKQLRSRGLSQSQISSLLGITQASVSLYLSSKPAKAYSTLASLSVAKEDADRYVALLAEDSLRDPTDAVETLISLWTGLLGKGSVCEAHRIQYPSLSRCDVCLRQFGKIPSEDGGATDDVAEAVTLLEDSKAFAEVMPEVSVNVARVAGSSESPEDVVAVPGRIVKVNGRARAMMPPSLGASGHMARVLLLARRRRPDLLAVVNLRYDKKMRDVLRRLKVRTLKVGGYPRGMKGDPTLEALALALAGSSSDFDALVDEGASGIEPNVYLFGESAAEVAKLAVTVAEAHSSR
jgi:predicted fused transcriptional regulator/phosphomethylpyrimidine kinase/predicted transcriptional regulator